MKTITRTRKVFLLTMGDYEDAAEYESQAQELADIIYELTRHLYAYSFDFRESAARMTNDQLMQEFDIAKEILNYTCDEVWAFGSTEPGTSMGGSNAFWVGENPLKLPEHIHRRFPFMRFSDDELPLKTYAKRVENTMYRVYAGYPPSKNAWQRFILADRDGNWSNCGSVLYPPNGVLSGYNSKKSFLSNADDWLYNYPEFKGRIRVMGSEEWGSTLEGYLKWWLQHIPHGEHKTDGIHDNWWHYVMNLDLVK